MPQCHIMRLRLGISQEILIIGFQFATSTTIMRYYSGIERAHRYGLGRLIFTKRP